MSEKWTFNPPPGWPTPPAGWKPPLGWVPDASWPEPPAGWPLWLPTAGPVSATESAESASDDPAEIANAARATVSASVHTEDTRSAAPAPSEGEKIRALEAEVAFLRAQLSQAPAAEPPDVPLDDDRVLQDMGIYRYHHPLENAAAFRERLLDLQSRIVKVANSGRAIVTSNRFTFDNSLAKGRKMSDDLGRLMLRAYNSEADNSIRSLRAGNAVTATSRLERTRVAIAKLGAMMEMRISDDFHQLRVEEIELTSDWLMMKQEEREAEREQRAQLREERRVQKELEEQRDKLDKERGHVENALAAVRAAGGNAVDLEARLAEIDNAIQANDFRAANIRAGYVYVISNRGAFGDQVVKIGLTRRLEPKERVYELGGASVPFRFDIHTLFFSEDAVSLENELHKHFAARALNQANPRKEFFFATPAEVREVLAAKVGNLLEFTEHPEAIEYLQSVGKWPASVR